MRLARLQVRCEDGRGGPATLQELLTKHKIVSEEFRRVTFHSRAVQVRCESRITHRVSLKVLLALCR